MNLPVRSFTVSRRIHQLHSVRHNSRVAAFPDSSAVVRVGGAESPDTCAEDRPLTSAAENPGAILRSAREAHGLSLRDVSRSTKISPTLLTALEQMRFDRLPALIFTRGFVKAYAREVGLDSEEMANRYLAGIAPPKAVTEWHDRPVPPPSSQRERSRDPGRYLTDHSPARYGWLVTGVAMLGLVGYLWSFARQSGEQAAPETVGSIASSDATPADGRPTAGNDAAAAALGDDTPIGPLVIQLTPNGPCWLAAAVDGTPRFARLLQAGESETIEAHDELVLRVGDPGTLVYSVNGRTGRQVGQPGEPINIRITRDNFRQFLGS
jgi:cytoskeleton protein RodZ